MYVFVYLYVRVWEVLSCFPIFALLWHTSQLYSSSGKVVSGYKVTRRGHMDEWQLIGKMDPQLPQMFYPVEEDMVIRSGDTVVSGAPG